MQKKTNNSDFQKIAKTKTDHSYPQAIEWVLIIVAMLALMSCFYYSDILITTRHGMNFWKCIADGYSIRYFYQYNSIPENTFIFNYILPQGSAYPFFVYLIFAIWDFPLFLLEHFRGTDIFLHASTLFYAKLIVFFFLILSMREIKKISLKLGVNEMKAKWSEYLFLTSAIVFMSIVAIGQFDILSVFFTLLGIRAYLEDNKIGFIGWFSVALMCKFFALLIFLPLTLLKNKKLPIALKDLVLVIIPYLFISSLFGAPASGDTNLTTRILTDQWLGKLDFTFGNVGIVTFIAVYLSVFICSYMINTDDKSLLNIYTIYICMAVYASMILFAQCHSYWYMIIIPFLTIMYALNNNNYRLNLLLDTFGLGAYYFSTMVRRNVVWYYDQYVFRPTFLKHIINFSSIPSGVVFSNTENNGSEIYVWDLINKVGVKINFTSIADPLLLILYTMFFVCMIFILIINNPKFWYGKNECESTSDNTCRGLIHFRTTVNIILTSLPIAAILYSAKNIYHCL